MWTAVTAFHWVEPEVGWAHWPQLRTADTIRSGAECLGGVVRISELAVLATGRRV